MKKTLCKQVRAGLSLDLKNNLSKGARNTNEGGKTKGAHDSAKSHFAKGGTLISGEIQKKKKDQWAQGGRIKGNEKPCGSANAKTGKHRVF